MEWSPGIHILDLFVVIIRCVAFYKRICYPYNYISFLLQNLWNLKIIDLSYSKKLIQMPDFSLAPNLEKMTFRSCTSMFQVQSHCFQNLDKLTHLDMSHCAKLSVLPNNFVTRSLVHLDLRGCRNLKQIPETKENVVVYLDLSETRIAEVPTYFVSFYQLATLKLEDCKDLYNLPRNNICQLKSLEYLSLSGCSSLETIPELPKNLHHLDLSKTAIEHVPSSIEALFRLTYYSLRGCKKLWSLPSNICKLKSLWELDLHGCSKFENFPEILEHMQNLSILSLSKTAIKRLPSSIDSLVSLSELRLRFCENLQFVPRSIYSLKKLRLLDLSSHSELLESLPPPTGGYPFGLDKLVLLDRNMLDIPFRLNGRLSWVRELYLIGKDLDAIPAASIHFFSELRYLSICNWEKLRSLPELPFSLEVLHVQDCPSLENVSRVSSINYFALTGGLSDQFFINCPKLDQNACNNIISDAQLRILDVARKASSKTYYGYVSLSPLTMCSKSCIF